MNTARVTRRPSAESDMESAMGWLAGNVSTDVAVSFIDAVEDALANLMRHPFTGRDWAHRLGVPDLRALLLNEHPYVLLYLAGTNEVDVVRVLHTSRDIDFALLSEQK